MSKQKYYVVKNGKINGIFLNWDDCKKMIHGHKNALYKSFFDPHEAIDYLISNNSTILKEENSSSDEKLNIKENANTDSLDLIEAYVDGSFDVSSQSYGSGGVLLKDGKIIETFSKKGSNKENVSMRNVAGEIEAAMIAMQYCYDNNYKNLRIYFDYNGIEKWCTGDWKANKIGTKKYKEFCDEMKKKVNISFQKVKAHSGVEYNELADKLAKESIFY
ncbi:RNase H [Peptostreptococcus russellii]|uniref:ribonuclease H n=1 Tax=Peptostreptococcus russellii TaxID=215200 RepID=A0A2P7Q1E4_9FIRM|nr:ribonuclease H family protein [Peptostreptococcus russellii]PSJ31782.1 RNase H [Peptostreptococcus russellii]